MHAIVGAEIVERYGESEEVDGVACRGEVPYTRPSTASWSHTANAISASVRAPAPRR